MSDDHNVNHNDEELASSSSPSKVDQVGPTTSNSDLGSTATTELDDDNEDFAEAQQEPDTSPVTPRTHADDDKDTEDKDVRAMEHGTNTSNRPPVPAVGHSARDAQELEQDSFILVAQLRSQITDLTSQVTSLNTKLVKSYTTNGDLEDELHDTKEREAQLRKRVAQLEKDSAKWEKEIEAGGWVERVSDSAVTTCRIELTSGLVG
jgi:chromosome segregation ATPase